MADNRDKLVEDNLKLVHYCANRFRNRGIEYDDLYQAGCMGLVKAAEGFDESRGLKFSTYAVPTILGEIKRLFRDGSAVRISRSIKELYAKCKNYIDHYISKQGREPTMQETADALGVSVEKVCEAINVSSCPVSLTPDEDGFSVEIPEQAKDDEIADRLSLEQVMGELDPNDRQLIELRFFKNKTQSGTAQVMGKTQVWVSRREKKILLYMRSRLE